MPVIDVDCHFDVTFSAEEHPLREWADRLPTLERYIADANSGDLGRSTPERSRPDEAILAMFLPDENRSSAEQAISPGKFPARFPAATPEERIGWFDGVGIDYALMTARWLTIITEELGVAWLPAFVARCDALGVAGPWPFQTTPGEMVRHNVRATPLIGLGDANVAHGLIQQLPEMLVFSSDYPHGEGNADPIALYEPGLSSLDEGLRASFLGANMAECFARTGDPLPER